MIAVPNITAAIVAASGTEQPNVHASAPPNTDTNHAHGSRKLANHLKPLSAIRSSTARL
jgi:hypothetical protein